MGRCMWPGHRALRYYLRSASWGNEDPGERCLLGTGICSHNIVHFYDSESRFAIHDDPGAGLRSTNTRSENRNITI